MTKRLISSLLIALLIVISAPAINAMRAALRGAAEQDKKKQDQGGIKLTTELVQIDVLVSDKNKKPVAGLKREDFELYDNSKPQQITTFSYEQTDKHRAGDQTTEARSLPRAIAAGELNRVIAFVVDTLHIKFENIYRTRKMLEDFVDNKMQPGDLVLILPTGGGSGLLQQFTSDRRMLHRAIDRLRPFFFSNDSTPYRSFARFGGQMGTGARGAGGLAMPRGGNIGAMPDPLEGADVRATLSALNETIKSMTRFSGRKVSVLVSEGLRIFATQTTSDLGKTTGLAARANVVFYTIDPRGLDPLTLDAADELTSDVTSASDSKRDNFFESQDSLRAIAADTGGKFFGNNNDIMQGLDAMLDENSAYYRRPTACRQAASSLAARPLRKARSSTPRAREAPRHNDASPATVSLRIRLRSTTRSLPRFLTTAGRTSASHPTLPRWNETGSSTPTYRSTNFLGRERRRPSPLPTCGAGRPWDPPRPVPPSPNSSSPCPSPSCRGSAGR